jgi:ribonucleotide reductase alpha subunit
MTLNLRNPLNTMFVIKRNGDKQEVKFDKITERINNLLTEEEKSTVDPTYVALQTIKRLASGMKTEELDNVSSEICANLNTTTPFYSVLGARILISNLHKSIKLYDQTLNSNFVNKMAHYQNKTQKVNEFGELIMTGNLNDDYLQFLINNQDDINKMIKYERDLQVDFFTYQTLMKSYFLRTPQGQILETPQDIFMRVASFIHMGNLENIEKEYNLMSLGYFIHASPTLFNSGTKRSQLASCFLMGTQDSIEGIFKNFTNCALIQKWAGGIGIHVSNIRGNDSLINGTGGKTNGIFYMLKLYNELSRYINQGGKRNGSIAIYIEPHHCDIELFLDLKMKTGDNNSRTRDLFLALWVSDYFMEKAYAKDGEDDSWYLMSPDECPGLTDVYGDEFKILYKSYVEQGKYKKKVSAKGLINKIFESMFETGIPYIAFKDHVNKKSNQKNLGTIKSSNLCIEIMQYSDSNEYAVCNLGSICLNKFVQNKKFDFEKLYNVAYESTINLNNVIDLNYYPVPETKFSNLRHRPVGLGIQGLADALAMMYLCYDCDEAVKFSGDIMETIYYGAMCASKDLAKTRYEDMKILCENKNEIFDTIKQFLTKKLTELNDRLLLLLINKTSNYADKLNIVQNEMKVLTEYVQYYVKEIKLRDELNDIYHKVKPNSWELNLSDCYGAYSSFIGSPFSEGKLQFDLWDHKPSNRYNWDQLKSDIMTFGTRNSLLTTCMPTATTSQIMGNNECFEPFTKNIYTRDTLAGSFIVCNKYLVHELDKKGIWTNELKNKIIKKDGSIQDIEEIDDNLKALFKTVYEISQTWVLKHAAARAPFVDQSQSMNIFFPEPDSGKLYSCIYKSWQLGLKTACYYLRTPPAVETDKFTICESCSG